MGPFSNTFSDLVSSRFSDFGLFYELSKIEEVPLMADDSTQFWSAGLFSLNLGLWSDIAVVSSSSAFFTMATVATVSV